MELWLQFQIFMVELFSHELKKSFKGQIARIKRITERIGFLDLNVRSVIDLAEVDHEHISLLLCNQRYYHNDIPLLECRSNCGIQIVF